MVQTSKEHSVISNISITKECFKELKKMSIDKEVTVKEVVSELLENMISKRMNKETK